MMVEDKLPYDFDLFFDIKSKKDLIRHVTSLMTDLQNIRDLMTTHGIEFTEEDLSTEGQP